MKLKQLWLPLLLAAGLCVIPLLPISRFEEPAPRERIDTTVPLQREGKTILRFANNHTPEFPTSQACDYFAELVEARSQGRILIRVFHNSELGDEKSVVEQTMYGGIDLMRVSTALLTDYSPQLIALQMPYLYEDSHHMWRVLDSGIGDSFLQSLQAQGLEGIGWFDAGARNFYTTGKEIRSAEDLAGMRIRVQESGYMRDFVTQLGAVPVTVTFEKTLNEMRAGRVDCAENNWPSYLSALHYTVAQHIVIDEHSRIPDMILINRQVLEELPEEDRALLRRAARDASQYQRELWATEEAAARRYAEEWGCEINPVFDKGELQQMLQPLYETYASGNEEVIAQIRDMAP